MMSAPVATNRRKIYQLTSRIQPLQMPQPPIADGGWKRYHILRGATAGLEYLTCHQSVLSQDRRPHPPHRHGEEELKILLSGEVDLILPDAQDLVPEHRLRLRPGQFIYYPSHFSHTLRTVSEEPANYLMFKWRADSTKADSPLAFGVFDALDTAEGADSKNGFRTRRLFEGPTSYLHKLHCHASTLIPGAGYKEHVDAYDVAIVLLEGEVETLGQRIQAKSVIFYAAGEPHGMFNPGHVTARYLVFEFHGSQAARPEAFPFPLFALMAKLANLRRWKRRVRRLLRHLGNRFSRRENPTDQDKSSIRKAA